MNDVNTFEKSFTESIRQASDDAIPKSINSSKPCPWTNAVFLNLLEQRRKCRDPVRLHELNLSIKNMRTKLKNNYISNLAKNINLANESRKVEEEFRLCKTYTMIFFFFFFFFFFMHFFSGTKHPREDNPNLYYWAEMTGLHTQTFNI